jgi:cytochrome c oxidase subunit 2
MARHGKAEVQAAEWLPRLTHSARRLAPLAVMGLALMVVLAGCGGMNMDQDQPYSTLSPMTSKTRDIQGLYTMIFWAALVVFVVVQAAIVYTVLKFRRRNDERPEQVHGSRVAEIAWTVIPAVLLLMITIPTIKTIFAHAEAEKTADFQVEVYGKQWWWEIQYPNIPASEGSEAGPLITANEVVLPQGANVLFSLRSNNVIHSFWVPQLSGKTDLMPGHDNKLQFVAENVGEYYGECAEFCGGAHAWMRFKVLVLPQDEFDAWVKAYQSSPGGEGGGSDVAKVPAAFGVCLVCHNVNGTNANIAKNGLASNPYGVQAGPNLTNLACRDTIAAGMLENTPENMRLWLTKTDEVKDGVYMPNYYKAGQINDEQVDELVTYLTSLKPAGGCPKDPPVGGNPLYVTTNTVDSEVPAAAPASGAGDAAATPEANQ